MKKRKKQIANFLKLGAFLLGVSLLLWNCEKDVKVDSILENKQHRKYDLSIQEKVTITDAQLLKELRIPINTTSLYKSTDKQLSKSKTVEVNTNEVAIAKTPAYEVYTFPLKNYDTSYDFQNLVVVKREAKDVEYLLLSYLKDNTPKNPNFPYKVYQQSLENNLNVVLSNKQAKTLSMEVSENKCYRVTFLPCGCGGNANGHGPSGPPCCEGSPAVLTEVSCEETGGCGDNQCPVPVDPLCTDCSTDPNNPNSPTPTDSSNNGSNLGGGSGGSGGSPEGPIYIYEGEEECFPDGTCTPPLYVPTVFEVNLNNILTTEQLMFLNQHPDLESEIKDFLRANNNSSEAQGFVKQVINAGEKNTLLTVSPFFKYPPDSNYEILYPKLTEYLKNQLPKVGEMPLIVNTIKKYTNLSIEEIKQQIKWGHGPTIRIEQLGENYGKFKRAEAPNSLYIDIDLVKSLESSEPGSKVADAFSFLLGVTTLHEYVHYGDYNYNGDKWDYPQEEGLLFETDVYGQVVYIENAEIILKKK